MRAAGTASRHPPTIAWNWHGPETGTRSRIGSQRWCDVTLITAHSAGCACGCARTGRLRWWRHERLGDPTDDTSLPAGLRSWYGRGVPAERDAGNMPVLARRELERMKLE